MAKYYITDIKGDDEFTLCTSEDKDEAVRMARREWSGMNSYDQERNRIEVRVYEEDIKNEDCTNFGYDTAEWGYLVDYHTGAGNEYAPDIETAKAIADDHAAYTQEDISIIDTLTGKTITRRAWNGVAYDSAREDPDCECENPIEFGSSGYYSDWVID